MNRFYLPIMEKLSIVDYSLYKCPLDISFSSKLNIVYGTNGTGKSTLLMMCLFSIVGPYRGGIKTKVRQEQRRDNRPLYDDSFFSERMLDAKGEPTVTASFRINRDNYVVTHSLQDGRLLSAEVNKHKLSGKIVTYKTFEGKYTKQRAEDSSTDELEEYLIFRYQEQLKKSTNLPGGVNTLISMLLDVMFFDEGRKLTFWNSDLQETIIEKYIVDAKFYEEYCEKKLTTKALESAYKKKSETLNYMSKFFEREKAEKGNAERPSDESLQNELALLETKIENMEKDLREDQALYSRRNNDLLSSAREEETVKEELSSLEDSWYKNLFPSQYEKYHNRFSRLMADGICPICGNKHTFSISTRNCIMCGEAIELNDAPDIIAIDIARQDCYNLLAGIRNKTDLLQKELESIRSRIDITRRSINKSNVRLNEIKALLNPDDEHTEDSDRKRLEKARSERDAALAEYNTSKQEEEQMRKTIEGSLVDNFTVFRSSFIRFASSFFGDHHTEDLSLPFSNDELLSTPLMKFELDGKTREEDYMLSESQRIFTDLSFRFSVLTTFHDKSFFVCETPDSTLDIFHEGQAVKTFVEYIAKGNSLILSANARHSSLIYDLYRRFAPDEVTVVDLTQISYLALSEKYSFDSYIKER